LASGERRVILVFALHYSPAAVEVLRAELGPDVEVRGLALPGLSESYAVLARQLRCPDGRLLEPLAHHLDADLALERCEAVFIVSWSAAYAFVRALLRDGADAHRLTGWISLDSGYSGKDADGTAADAQVAPFLPLVAAAADNAGALVWAGYTDVVTGPAVANTGAFWREVRRLSGREPGGLFKLEHWPGTRARDHVAARDTHGPAFVAAALDAWRAEVGEATRPTWPTILPILEIPAGASRVLDAARAEVEAGVREVPPGSNDGPTLRGYAKRLRAAGGTWAPGWAWCCLFVWACANAARVPIPPVVAVHRLVAWAVAAGCWRERSAVPLPGWLAVYKRGGADPRHGGEGHVEIVESYTGPEHSGIGGNVNNRVTFTAHRLDDEPRGGELVGWIALG
jgi:hypothetical protein